MTRCAYYCVLVLLQIFYLVSSKDNVFQRVSSNPSKGRLLKLTQIPGKFSFKYPKIDFDVSDKQSENSPKIDKDQCFIEDCVFDNEAEIENELIKKKFDLAVIKPAVSRLFTAVQYIKEEKYRLLFLPEEDLVIVSLKLWPIGWKHYTVYHEVSSISEESEGASHNIRIQMYSKGPTKTLKHLRFELNLNSTNSGDAIIVDSNIKYTSAISNDQAILVGQALSKHIRDQLSSLIDIYEVRKTQSKEYLELSKSAEEKKKKQELDKIIHPEKYRNKSPTVKPVGTGKEGSGRFVPSEATKARRQVRKGG